MTRNLRQYIIFAYFLFDCNNAQFTIAVFLFDCDKVQSIHHQTADAKMAGSSKGSQRWPEQKIIAQKKKMAGAENACKSSGSSKEETDAPQDNPSGRRISVEADQRGAQFKPWLNKAKPWFCEHCDADFQEEFDVWRHIFSKPECEAMLPEEMKMDKQTWWKPGTSKKKTKKRKTQIFEEEVEEEEITQTPPIYPWRMHSMLAEEKKPTRGSLGEALDSLRPWKR